MGIAPFIIIFFMLLAIYPFWDMARIKKKKYICQNCGKKFKAKMAQECWRTGIKDPKYYDVLCEKCYNENLHCSDYDYHTCKECDLENSYN